MMVMAALCRDAAMVQAQINDVNVGSAPDATDGDTVRNAFIKCNTDFNWIGGQLNGIGTTLAGLSTAYDPYGLALSIGLYGTNYTRYVVGTNTVAWLGLLNSCSNVLQGDITGLTNNVNSLWSALGGSGGGFAPIAPTAPSGAGLLHSGSKMLFDEYQALDGGFEEGPPDYGWTQGIWSDGWGTIHAYQFQGNLIDASGNGDWSITDQNGDLVNGGMPPTDIYGWVPVSQNNGSWLWTPPDSLSFTHMSFEQNTIYSYANSGVTSMIVDGNFQADAMLDSYGQASYTSGQPIVPVLLQDGGLWQWQALPTFPTTLNFDSGNISSDGSGDATFVSLYAQQLKDSSGGTGGAGDYAQANGAGGWSWTAWPSTLNYDAGDITSDGAGNVDATGFRGSFLDNGNSSGASGYVPTANGDGSWTWTVPTGGGSGGSFPDITDSGGVVTIANSVSITGSFTSDNGGVHTDGGGDMTVDKLSANSDVSTGELWATSLMDNNFSSGTAGSVPTANGDGSWTWAPGGGGGSGGTMNFDGGQITSSGAGVITMTDPGFDTSVSFADINAGGANQFYLHFGTDANLLMSQLNQIGDGTSVVLQGGNDAGTANLPCEFRGAQDTVGTAGLIFAEETYGTVMTVNNGVLINYTWNPPQMPGYTLDVTGTAGDSADGTWNVDGSGNFTANTFNPVSDRARKDNITPLAPANALGMALAITNYTWRFKARTNWVVSKIPTSLGTNLVTFLRTNKLGKLVMRTNSVVVTNSFVLATNAGKVFPASGKEFGPMAQDWHATTGLGGGTNISVTSMNGLLLGAVQGLAMEQGTLTNAAGARFKVMVNAATNGLIFVPQ